MTLHETYATLIRRGMPKHPRLAYRDWAMMWDISNPRGMGECHTVHGGYINEDDACDIVGAHALRWFARLNHHVSSTAEMSAGFAWERAGEGDSAQVLTHILAATAHLEPKES